MYNLANFYLTWSWSIHHSHPGSYTLRKIRESGHLEKAGEGPIQELHGWGIVEESWYLSWRRQSRVIGLRLSAIWVGFRASIMMQTAELDGGCFREFLLLAQYKKECSRNKVLCPAVQWTALGGNKFPVTECVRKFTEHITEGAHGWLDEIIFKRPFYLEDSMFY